MDITNPFHLRQLWIDPAWLMSKLSPKIDELISTPIRKEIFKVIGMQKDGFTKEELLNALRNKNIRASMALVQNLLKALRYRGYLQAHALKETQTAGRSTIHYRKASS